MKTLSLTIVAVLMATCITGCASFMGAESPEQRFYAAQGLYIIAVEEAVVYARRPDADPSVAAVLRVADREAHRALVAGREVLAMTPSSDRDQRLVFYANAAKVAIARLLEALEPEATP